MMRFIPLLFALAPCALQDGEMTLQKLIDKMEQAAAPARGSQFVAQVLQSPEAFLYGGQISVATDGTVRVISPPEDTPWARYTARNELVLGPEGFYYLQEQPGNHPNVRLRVRTEKFAPGADERVDPFIDPPGFRHDYSSFEIFLHALSPRRSLAFERNLELVGKGKFGAGEAWLLTSRRSMNPVCQEEVKRFLVDATTHRLRRLEVLSRFTSNTTLTIMSVEDWTGAIPSRVTIGPVKRPQRGFVQGRGGTWVAESIKTGLALDASSLIPDPEDLYATQSRAWDILARLKGRPDDLDLNYSYALSQGDTWADSWGRKVDLPALANSLEKVTQKSWKPSPIRNLLYRYLQQGDKDKAKGLVDRIERDGPRHPRVIEDAAAAAQGLGLYDRAVALIRLHPNVPETLEATYRIQDLLGKGEEASAIAELMRLEGKVPSYGLKFDRNAFLKALDAAIEKNPTSVGLQNLRLPSVVEAEDLARLAGAIKDAVRSKDSKLLEGTLTSLSHLLVPWLEEKRMPAERIREASEALLAALAEAGEALQAGWIRGVIYRALDRKEDALREYAREIEILDQASPNWGLSVMFLVRDLKSMGQFDLMEKAGRLYTKSLRSSGQSNQNFINFEWEHLPITVLVRHLVAHRRFADLYHAVKGLPIEPKFAGGSIGKELGLFEADLKEFHEVAKKEALREQGDVAGLMWLARVARADAKALPELDVADLFEKVLERGPKDPEVLQALAEESARSGSSRHAIRACEQILALPQPGLPRSGKWTLERTLLLMAEQLRKDGRSDDAVATLAKFDFKREDLRPYDLWRASESWLLLGKPDKAREALDRVTAWGYRPHARLAKLAVMAKEWVEAMRHVNRAGTGEADRHIPDPESHDLGSRPAEEPEDEKLEWLRKEIYRQAGEDYFIDRLLAAKPQAMTADEEKRAKAAADLLSAEDIEARGKALAELKAIGAKCAPLLKPSLTSSDPEIRARARALMTEWAEPR